MEHRLSFRTPLTMNVAIYYKGLGLLQGRSLDVSRHGMFVTMGPMVLPLHAVVDVAFPIETGKHSKPPQRTPAMVVRLADKGVGLMFAEEVHARKTESYIDDRQEDSRLIVDATSG